MRRREAKVGARLGSVAACVLLQVLATPLRAQDRDPAAAQALFDQAVELTKHDKYDEACPKFQESNRLDPSIGAQFQLANCHERNGRIASAWAMFLDVASQSRARAQLEREAVARERAAKLEPRLPRLVVTVPEGSKVPGLEIRRNGILVGAAQWGTPMPVDPGEVELTLQASGKESLRQRVRLEEGKTFNYSVPALADAAPVTARETTPASAATEQPAVPAPPRSPSPPADAGTNRNRPWVIGLSTVGVAGLAVGTTFALLALSKYEQSKDDCDKDDVNACGSHGIELRDEARTKGDIATVGFIVGGVGLAGAGVLWLTGAGSAGTHSGFSSRLRAAPVWAPGTAALFVQGDY
jgi:tetratricopeptide (TPR) repeat protein